MPTNLLTIVGKPPWFYDRPDRACAGIPTSVFFPDGGGASEAAQQICMPCPFKADCLRFALDNDVEGVWGGTGQNERARMRARRRRKATNGPSDDRRRQVAALTAAGKTCAEIAQAIGVTPRSVERLRRDVRNGVGMAA